MYVCSAFNCVLLVKTKKLKIAGFFALLPFLTYLYNKLRLQPSLNTVCSIMKKNSTGSMCIELIK